MNAKKNITILILIFATVVMLVTGIVHAYFNYSNQSDAQITVESEQTVVSITRESELIEFTRDGNFNNYLKVNSTEGKGRKVLRLENDITLGNDIFITADISLDLNGKTLSLNGKNISVNHSYYGIFAIDNNPAALSDGVIERNDTEKIYLQIPNATLLVGSIENGNVIFKTAGQLSGSFIQINSISLKYTAYDIFYSIGKELASDTDILPARLVFGEMPDENDDDSNLSLLENVLVFQNSFFVSKKVNLDSALESYISYVTQNIDLPLTYYGYENITIDYVSTSSSIISTNGEFFNNQITEATALDLTATVYIDDIAVAKCVYNIIALPNEQQEYLKLGKALISNYLNRYKDENGLIAINTYLSLPASISSYGLEFSYKAYSKIGETYTVINGSFEYDESGKIYIFAPTLNTVRISVIVKAGQYQSQEIAFNMTTQVQVKINEFTIAKSIVSSWYSSIITIEATAELGNVNGYSAVNLRDTYTDESYLSDRKISSVNYELVNNEAGAYGLITLDQQNKLHVTGTDPAHPVILNVKFVFYGNDPDVEDVEIIIQVPVEYKTSGKDGSSNASRFSTLYTYFNRSLFINTGYYTLDSFYLPFAYGQGLPIISLGLEDISGNNTVSASDNLNGATKVYICYYDSNGTEIKALMSAEKVIYTEGEVTSAYYTFNSALDLYISSNDLTYADLIAKGAQWFLEIDTDKIPFANSNIELRYFYKFLDDNNTSEWKQYTYEINDGASEGVDLTSYRSYYTLIGIVRSYLKDGTTKSPEGISDEYLYKWIFDNFNEISQTYSVGSSTHRKSLFIYYDWLSKNIAFNYNSSDIVISLVSNYSGLKYLYGTQSVNLSGYKNANNSARLTIAEIQAIAQMQSLSYLNLNNCGLGEGSLTTGETQLLALSQSQSITELDISNNNIYKFNSLLNFSKLTTLKIYNNQRYGINSIFYGSLGLINISVFEVLSQNGVIIYNETAGGEEKLFGEVTLNNYIRTSNIVYQKSLDTNSSIENLYKVNGVNKFSTTPSHYGINSVYSYYANATATTAQTITVTNQTITFDYIGTNANTSTAFTLTYSCTLNGQTVQLTVVFPVERI